jgi:two-component system phosphate regulon response regulator PhoB
MTHLALIVEDEEDLATIFSRVMKMAGFEVAVAQDGHAALNYLTRRAPDLVILDLHLPGVSGEDILREIRSNERLAATRVVIVTADLLQAEALSDQADATLIKPIRIHQLLDVAHNLYPS